MKWRRHIGGFQEASEVDPFAGDHRRVLVVSASMGAGHDGAASVLAERLRSAGHHAEVRDFLDAGPLRIGTLLKEGYEFELRHVPSAYDVTYRLWFRVPWMAPVISWLVAALTRRRMAAWIRDCDADVVVSTYPLATLCLGRMRRRGWLAIPAVNFITDFGVHPLWVHKGIDLNLTVHPEPARAARQRTGRRAIACGPMVSDAYARLDAPGTRARARARWGLADGEKAVLVVAGSWGIGGIRETFDAISGHSDFVPVVVCGRDEAVLRQVSEAAAAQTGRSIIVGWTNEMPSLMAACDTMVENAGGLTSLEAMRAGLPVVSFRPIAGHGVENTWTMAKMGVSRMAGSAAELLSELSTLCAAGPERSAQVAAAQDIFVCDGARLTLDAADAPPPPLAFPARPPVRLVARTTTAMAALLGLTWVGLTTGVSVAAAAGAGVAHPVAGASQLAYVGVRLSAGELANRSTQSRLAALGVTAVLDEQTAQGDPPAVHSLVGAGVDIANGGRGEVRDRDGEINRPAQWNRAKGDVDAGRQLSHLTGRPVIDFVPGRRVNAFDLVDSARAHATVVVPNHVLLTAADIGRQPLTGDKIYLVDGLSSTPGQLNQLLGQLRGAFGARHLVAVPLDALR